jgi:hypothetical protein
MATLTGKTIGELALLTGITSDTLFAVELSGATYHIPYSGLSSNATSIEVTYSELVDKITGETLNTGSYYIITDFRTCYDQPDFDYNGNPIINTGITSNYKQGPVEPILVLSTSANTISEIAYQPAYPKDKIKYDWTFSATEVTNNVAFGRITERVDEFNNRTDYDHRVVLFRRYENYYYKEKDIAKGTIELIQNTGEVIGTGTEFSNYNIGDYIAIPNSSVLFFEVVSISADTSMVVSGLTIPDVLFGSSFYFAQKDGLTYKQNNISIDYTEHPTFLFDDETIISNYIGDVASFINWGVNTFLLPNNVFGEDVIGNRIGNNFRNNTFKSDVEHNVIGDYFEYNTIYNDEDFTDNQIASNFYYNLIVCDDFNDNVIGDNCNNNKIFNNIDFVDNQIGVGFNNNTIYDDFEDNKIGNGFYNNIVDGNFYDNLIGNGFYNNEIIKDFNKNEIAFGFNNNSISGETYTNRIGEQFENNTIYGNFNDNQIFNEFKGNITYQDFNYNRLDWGFGGNQISGNCFGNIFGSYISSNDFLGDVYENTFKGSVFGNTIGNNFANNNIGVGFSNNTIGEDFGNGGGEPQGNIIGNYFIDNTIGEYFYNNTIPDNFHDNIVGDYFQWNVINTNIDYTDFTINYGNITGFSYTATGTGATDSIYTNLTGTTNGHGVSATFDVEVSSGAVIGVSASTPTTGYRYQIGDTITILGTDIGGTTPEDNIVITVIGTTSGSLFYQHFTKQIFERRLGDKRVSFYDENDVLNVDSVYEISGYIPVYSQSLSFPFSSASFEFECDGSYTNNGGITNQSASTMTELVTVFNNNFRQFGYFFDNNDGTIGLYINPSLKQQYCPSGTYTINVFNN